MLQKNIKIIAHRGLLDGPNSSLENNPQQIVNTITWGFDVEIDLWCIEDKLYLGHDEPKYEIDKSFLNDKMWIHCKNFEAMESMLETDLNWFWHDKDKVTLTSWGVPWCYPYNFIKGGITVEFRNPHELDKKILGICTDYPIKWYKFMEQK